MRDTSFAIVSYAGQDTQAAHLPSLGRRQTAILLSWGVLLWFSAAMFIRYVPAALFGRGAATALLFAAAVPVAWVTIWATRRVASLRSDQLVAGAALGSAAAMFCDGIALTWTSLYGSDRDLVPAAAWLLWGVAAILVSAFVAARQDGA